MANWVFQCSIWCPLSLALLLRTSELTVGLCCLCTILFGSWRLQVPPVSPLILTMYKSSSFHLPFYIRSFSPWPSWCTSAVLTAICQCLSWTSPKLDARLQMWPPMCQTEGKDHFPATASYPVGNNHLGCGWLAHYWLIFNLLSIGTLRSVSVKLLCSSIGIWGCYILDVGLQLL